MDLMDLVCHPSLLLGAKIEGKYKQKQPTLHIQHFPENRSAASTTTSSLNPSIHLLQYINFTKMKQIPC